MKLILKTLDEVAKWRKTSFKTKLTNEEILALEQKYGIDNLYIHFDSGVARSSRGFGYQPPLAKQKSLTDKPDWSKDPDEGDPSLTDVSSAQRVPQKSFNPQTRFKTPVGIYIYQLRYAREVIGIKDFGSQDDIRHFPFAADSAFIYFYYIPPQNILELNDFWKTNLFSETLTKAKVSYRDANYSRIEAALRDAEFFNLTKNNISIVDLLIANKQGDSIWELFRDNYDQSAATEVAEKAFARCWFYFTNNLVGNNINKWSKFIVDLGVKSISDYGNGIIHPSEPHQGVIIDTAAAKLVSAKENPNDTSTQASEEDKDAYNDKIVDKYSGYARFSDNQTLLNKIFGFQNASLDAELCLNKNASKKMLLSMFNRPYSVGNLAKNLIANPVMNRDEVKAQFIKIMDLYGTDEGARAAKKYKVNDLIYTSFNSSLMQDSDYRERLFKYFSTDAGTVRNLLGSIVAKLSEEDLRKIIVGMKSGSAAGDAMTIKGRLFYNLLWGRNITPSAEWVHWLWNLNDPDLDREVSIIRIIDFYNMNPSGDKVGADVAKAFKETVYKNPIDQKRVNAAWEYIISLYPDLQDKIAAEQLFRFNKRLNVFRN